MNRHLSRIIIMQTIYEWDFRKITDWQPVARRNYEAYNCEADWDYIETVVTGIMKEIPQIDQKISNAAPEWPLEQIACIDKAILRLAVYELLHADDVPPKVAINEAIELAKSFGGENSSKFINGVLGTLYRQSDKYREEEDTKRSQEKKENSKIDEV